MYTFDSNQLMPPDPSPSLQEQLTNTYNFVANETDAKLLLSRYWEFRDLLWQILTQANDPKPYSLSWSLISGKTSALAVLELSEQKTPESVVMIKRLLTLVWEEMP